MTGVQFRETDPIKLRGKSGVGLPGTDSIGMGLDVFQGFYASPRGTTLQLFELGPYADCEIPEGAYFKPEFVHVQTLQEGGIVRTEGRTSREYQSDRAGKVGLEGGYGFFSGSLDAEFTRNERRCTTYSFVAQTDRFYKYLLSIVPRGTLADMVRAGVRADLDGMESWQLFRKYGTYFLQSLVIGATSVYSSATDNSSYTSKIATREAIELRYKVLTKSFSGDLSADQETALREIGSSSHLEIFVQGGQAELASGILAGSYQQWIQSIGKNMAYVGLNVNSLQPIWSLCAGRRRDELEAAFDGFAKMHPADDTPDIVRIHHFSTNVNTSRHHYSQNVDAFPDKDWQLKDGQFRFYAFKSPAPDRIPIYRHEAEDGPRRFKLSSRQKIGHGWSNSTDIAFYAYKERGEERVAVFGYVADSDPGQHGWLYTPDETVRRWSRVEIAFYAPEVR